MLRAARSFVASVAILAVLLTAGVVGAARGQAAAAGEMVICAGGQAVTIAVDADGNPTGPPHWCPDCVLLLLAGIPAAPALPEPPGGFSDPARAPDGAAAAPVATHAPLARGPPAA